MLRLLIFFAILLVACGLAAAQPRTVIEWKFDKDGDTKGWVAANHVKPLTAAGGVLRVSVIDWDPFLFSPEFSIPATPSQEVQVAMKTKARGGGEVFWTNTLKSEYSGFSPGKETPFNIEPSADFKVYTIRPFWQAEQKIIKLRLDLAAMTKGNTSDEYEIAWIRVVDQGEAAAPVTDPSWDFTKGAPGWTMGGTMVAPPLKVDAGTHGVFSARMSVTGGKVATIGLAAAETNGVSEATMPIIADGKMHEYNFPVHSATSAGKTFIYLTFRPTDDDKATAKIEWLKLAQDPQGPAELEVTYLGLDEALPRAGRPCTIRARIGNRGGDNATDVQATLTLPAGVSFAPGEQAVKAIPTVEFGFPESAEWRVVAAQPTEAKFTVRVGQAENGRVGQASRLPGAITAEATETILPSLNLPTASYVPEPKPVLSDYEIGALYFPGWSTARAWDPIRRVAPIRKPVLGWYDETKTDCVDWQIKWAAEHGIKFFMVDWYWSAGGRSLEHWVQAYQKAKYPKMTLLEAEPRVEIMDNLDTAYQRAKELFKKYPALKGILGTSSLSAPGTARAIEELGLKGKAFVTSVGLPNENKPYLKSGTLQAVMLWDSAEAGYAMLAAAVAVLKGDKVANGINLKAKGWESMTFAPDSTKVLLGKSWISITKANVDSFGF